MTRKLIYEIRRPFCGFHQVSKETFDNPPQFKWPPPIVYDKRILVEATPEEVEEAEYAQTDHN